MRTLRLMIVVSLTGAILGCGQKGPLVLPDAQHPRKTIGRPHPPAPAAPVPAAPAGTAAPAPSESPTGGESKSDTAPQN